MGFVKNLIPKFNSTFNGAKIPKMEPLLKLSPII